MSLTRCSDARNTACKKYSTTVPGFRSRPDAERADTLFHPRSALEVARSILSVREPLVIVETLDFPAPRRRVTAERKPVVAILCPIGQDADTPPSPFAAPLPTPPSSDRTPLPTFAQLAPPPAPDSVFPSSAWALARRPRIIPPPPSIRRTPLPFEQARPAKRRRNDPSPIPRPATAPLARLDGSETLMFVRVAPTPSTSSSAADSKPKAKTEGEAANVRRAPKQSRYLAGVLKTRKVTMLSTPDVAVASAVEETQALTQARKAVPFGRRADGNGKHGLSTWHSVPETADGDGAAHTKCVPQTRDAVPFGKRVAAAKQARPVNTDEDAVVVPRQALASTTPAQAPGLIDEDEDDVVEVPPPHAPVRAEAARPTNKMPAQAKSSRQGIGPMKQTTLSFSKPKR
ncbi:hypothetical protein EXIGLDRAFT_718521 [Exidia glandulosa HHB12029]|uniref:Uncharacterized protein n=1 Tax=Exidia glandulosa HHB12029 TaxID=1314781 RepID=A0A165NYS2_EXIGL|nr:hypothetical protein EXIGLDRAFT_718521 [Exidia glandulosa HHB12029]